jgi:Protein of unknown function (DUF732)
MRASAITVGMLAVAATLAAPAGAEETRDEFLNALNEAGVTYDDPAATAALGERVCPMLVEPGKSFASVASAVGNSGIPPDMAAFFTGIAISMYCPSAISSLGNGTILDWLPAGLAPRL